MLFPSQGTPSALTDSEEDGMPPRASQIVLAPRQEALRERQGTAHASAVHSSARSRPQPGGGMLPGSLPTEAAEEVKSEGRAEVTWQDKSKTAQAAAQGGRFCICPPPPAQPVPTSALGCQPDRDVPGACFGGCSPRRLRWEHGEGLAGQPEPPRGKGPANKRAMQLSTGQGECPLLAHAHWRRAGLVTASKCL